MGESISKLERSLKSLREAIKGEYNAIKKYELYKKIAEDEGYHNIAKLFKGLIAGENIHLKNHRNALKSILKEGYKSEPKVEEPDLKDFHNNTIMNVKDAIKGETWEYKEMYPNLIKALKKELKNELAQVAKLSFTWARNVELTHTKVLKIALSQLEKGKDLDDCSIWVCSVCGNIVIGDKDYVPKELCPVCKHDPSFYKKILDD